MSRSKSFAEARSEVSSRLADLRPVVEEYELLTGALAALDAVDGASDGDGQHRRTRPRSGQGPARRRPAATMEPEPEPEPEPVASAEGVGVDGADSSSGSSHRRAGKRTAGSRPRKRAPRGANRAAVLSVVVDRPGATSGEIAAASGVDRNVVYSLLRLLVANGELRKEELPTGTTGYAIAQPTCADVEATE